MSSRAAARWVWSFAGVFAARSGGRACTVVKGQIAW